MENKIIICPSVFEDIEELAPNLRQDDIREVVYCGYTPFQALLRGFIFSDTCYSVKFHYKTIGMFGVSDYTMPKGYGSIWFLGADECINHPVSFVKQGIKYTTQFLRKYDILLNAVHSQNTSHINWLKAIGFTITSPVMINNHKFYQFYKLKE